MTRAVARCVACVLHAKSPVGRRSQLEKIFTFVLYTLGFISLSPASCDATCRSSSTPGAFRAGDWKVAGGIVSEAWQFDEGSFDSGAVQPLLDNADLTANTLVACLSAASVLALPCRPLTHKHLLTQALSTSVADRVHLLSTRLVECVTFFFVSLHASRISA